MRRMARIPQVSLAHQVCWCLMSEENCLNIVAERVSPQFMFTVHYDNTAQCLRVSKKKKGESGGSGQN